MIKKIELIKHDHDTTSQVVNLTDKLNELIERENSKLESEKCGCFPLNDHCFLTDFDGSKCKCKCHTPPKEDTQSEWEDRIKLELGMMRITDADGSNPVSLYNTDYYERIKNFVKEEKAKSFEYGRHKMWEEKAKSFERGKQVGRDQALDEAIVEVREKIIDITSCRKTIEILTSLKKPTE